MSSVNRVILIGNLGADPELKHTPSGVAVANARIATSEQWKDKQTGERQEKTEWHRLVFWNRLAEIVGEYLRKGSKVYVEGSLETRKWTDKNDIERFTTEVKVRDMKMLDGKSGTSGGAPSSGGSATPDQHPPSRDTPHNGFDDDIPFVTALGHW